MTYSLELRQHIFKVKQKEGLTFEETAARFHVSARTLFRWEQRLEPQVTHKKHSRKIDLEALAKHVEQEPNGYQRARAAYFGVSQPSIWAALKELKISYKKNTHTP